MRRRNGHDKAYPLSGRISALAGRQGRLQACTQYTIFIIINYHFAYIGSFRYSIPAIARAASSPVAAPVAPAATLLPCIAATAPPRMA